MIVMDKQIGETPLQMIDRLRRERPELEHETLSYAGRLDPLAYGQMVVLVGDEVFDREKYLAYEKEYVVQFLIGVATDTGDVLGLMTDAGTTAFDAPQAEQVLEKIKSMTEQTYPWFSGKTVDGIKLFDHFKAGNTTIVRPKRSVHIRKAELLEVRMVPVAEIEKRIFESIALVSGDFRQAEIATRWKDFFASQAEPCTVVTMRFIVSSGTFIRGFPELFPVPVVVYDLYRPRIFMQHENESGTLEV